MVYESSVAVYRLGPSSFVPSARGSIQPFVDRISNAVSIRHEDFMALVKDATPGALPLSDESMRALLHELTHHATFANNVGRAQSALAISVAARASIGVAPKGSGDLWLGERDDLVLRYFRMLFEPLMEGLALFGEHDIRWGPLPIASHPFSHLWPLFFERECTDAARRVLATGGPDAKERARNEYAQSINARLANARTSEDWIDSKLLLLEQPLSGYLGGPPYLLGYLATKRAFLEWGRNPVLRDSDLYLMMMIHHWFADEEVALLLLEPNDAHLIRVQNTLSKLLDRFQDRWSDLYKNPLEILRSLENSFDQRKEYFGLFEAYEGIRTACDSINAFVPKFAKHRLMVRIGFVRVNVETKNNGRAEIRDAKSGSMIFECPLVENSDIGEYPGTIELVRTYSGDITALLVIGPTGLVGVRELFSSNWNSPEVVAMFDDFPSIEHAEAAAKSCRESFFAISWTEKENQEFDTAIMKDAVKFRDHIYLQIAFPGAREGRRLELLDRLGVAGFSSVFNDSAELREIARLSLYFGGPGAAVEDVARDLDQRPADLSQFIHKVNATSRNVLGVDVFTLEDGIAIAAL